MRDYRIQNRIVAYVALGSNRNGRENVSRAAKRLVELSESPSHVSSLWESTPVDCPPGSPNFVNAVVKLIPRAGETPESLLRKLQALEKEFGRLPKKVLNEPRPLDLDLITFGEEQRNTPELTLPHPRAHQRRFVLQPLAQIAPSFILPGQAKTVVELLNNLPSGEKVEEIKQQLNRRAARKAPRPAVKRGN
jgi:2-amino-4-hydroxy-6-hydroxymethyldihydropteridine diphosphokinase